MIIKDAKFITSFSDAAVYEAVCAEAQYPAEFCFAGRSNVGKSTFINTLCGRKLAKTSSTPGRTRLINIFSVSVGLTEDTGLSNAVGANTDLSNGAGQFTLVDLPGYGYAKAAKSEKNAWQALAEGYFSASKSLKQVFVLADCRHESALDRQLLEYLYFYSLPFTILASKCDKLSRAELDRSIIKLAAFLKVGRDNIICVSDNGMGRDGVLKRLESLLS